MNYYDILGVTENASQDDIKKAYKKLAMTHHPDRGGDNKKFQEISQAYDTLSDSTKKNRYDAELHGMGDPFIHVRSGSGFPDFGEIFGFQFGQGFAQHQQSRSRRNRDLTIRISITFKQSFLGTQIEAKYNTPSGNNKTIVIDVPAGVESGQVIRYGGLGDDSIPSIPAGNLNVTVIVDADPEWQRQGLDLIKLCRINAFEAIIGCNKEIQCLDGNVMSLKIRAGLQHGTEFVSQGRGFRDLNTGRVGSLIVVVNIDIPEITDANILKQIESIHAQVNTLS